jgi:hypothetical protein
MNKEFILSYAKGEKYNPAYCIVYSVESTGKVLIHSCSTISGQNESVFIRKTYHDQEIEVSEKEVIHAVMDIKNR